MKKHKWHKEIKHLADGGEIEYRTKLGKGIWSDWSVWDEDYFPEFNNDIADEEYRIKPQPKEPQYYYVWQNHKGEVLFHLDDNRIKETPIEYKCIGRLELRNIQNETT